MLTPVRGLLKMHQILSGVTVAVAMAVVVPACAEQVDSQGNRLGLASTSEQEIAFQHFDAIMRISSIEVQIEEDQEHAFKRDIAVAILSSMADRLGNQNHHPSYDELMHALECLHAVYGRIADKYSGNGDGKPWYTEVEAFNESYKEFIGLEEVIEMIRFRKVDSVTIQDRWYQIGH